MKKSMNPRKKYANGTTPAGVGPNNYIQSPNEVLNDYNIMLAKAEQESLSNQWLPIAGMIGGLAQSAIGFAGKGGFGSGKEVPAVTTPEPKLANGMNNVNQDVEVEGGEMYETPEGQTGEFKGPSHEQGGIPMEVNQDIPEGTKVYSDRLKVGKETLAERKANRERKIANLEKIASQPLIDTAVKNAAKRKMESIQKEEMSDLQFQEQVNNIQQMADTMIAAFGTGIAGLQDNPIGASMEYAMGTGADGVMKYPWGTPPFGVKKNPYADPLNYDTNAVKNLHDALGIASTEKGYGTAVGPKTLKAYQGFATDYMKKQGYSTVNPNNFPDISRFYKNGKVTLNQGEAQSLGLTTEGSKYIGPKSNFFGDMADDVQGTLPKTDFSTDALASKAFETTDPFAMTAGEDWAKANPLPEGMEVPMAGGIDFKSDFFPGGFGAGTGTAKKAGKKGPSGFMKALSGSLPGVGDLTGLFGDYLGGTAGLKNAAESRSTDVTNRNVYANVGKESQKQLDNAMGAIENSKAQAIVKATTTTQGGKRSGRNSARGVNQMRAMDWLYDTALNEQIASISSNAATQVADIFKSKSSVAMNADQLKGQGEYQANMANEAAKDAYYTARGMGLKDQALAVQQGSKDLNAMKQNKVKWNIAKKSGIYGQGNDEGDITNKAIEITDPRTGKKISVSMEEYQKFIAQSTKTT